MSPEYPPPPIASPRERRPRRGWLIALPLLAATLGLLEACHPPPPPPPPPQVDTAGYDPLIAAAIAHAREAVLSNPRSAAARGRMGEVLLAHEIRAQAGDCFAQASACAPREARWAYLHGLAQLVDNPAAAATNFDRAVRMFSDRELVPRLRLADTLVNLGRMTEAEAQYREVFQRDPNSALGRLGMGKIANAKGQFSQAVEFLEGARQDPSTRQAAHRLLLNLYQRLGRTNEAEQVARTLARLPNDLPLPDPFLLEIEQLKTGEVAWTEMADDWIKAGRAADAVPLLEKTVQTYPKSDRGLFLLGRARFRQGDPAGAEAVLRRATELAPGSVEAQMQLGVVQLALHHPQDAERSFRAALQAKPTLPEGWFNLALSLGNRNRTEAVAAFRESIRLKPNFVEAYLGLAVVLRAEGKAEAAAAELRQALALQPEERLRQRVLEQLKQIGP